MKTVPAGEFKAKCLRLMEEVSQTGEPLLVTKRGKPLVTLSPGMSDENKRRQDLDLRERIRKELAGSVTYVSDVEVSMEEAGWDETEAEWNELYK